MESPLAGNFISFNMKTSLVLLFSAPPLNVTLNVVNCGWTLDGAMDQLGNWTCKWNRTAHRGVRSGSNRHSIGDGVNKLAMFTQIPHHVVAGLMKNMQQHPRRSEIKSWPRPTVCQPSPNVYGATKTIMGPNGSRKKLKRLFLFSGNYLPLC